jgi:MoaA/NifB/PqqE/SkfB family radical SAM enzyme
VRGLLLRTLPGKLDSESQVPNIKPSSLIALPDSSLSRPHPASSPHRIQALPILVLFPHNRCNCRCMMCDIWRIRQVREITVQDLARHLESIRALRVRWVVFSGGEPQMHTDLAALARLIRAEGIRVTLLTAGLLLEPYAQSVVDTIDDVIVSLDGPREVHNRIRGVPKAFDRLVHGVRALRQLRPAFVARGRSTVQKANYRYLRETVRTAKQIGLDSISFLAADVTSEAFNRPGSWTGERQNGVALDAEDVGRLEEEIESLIREYRDDITMGFVVETAEKLRRIVLHFRAHLGQLTPVAPRCNAPWVSAVIEADGTVRPCFFHRALGNIHEKALIEILNGEAAVDFRRALDIPKDPVCQKCVCSLHVSEESQKSL